MLRKAGALALGVAALAGCASRPTTYLTLSAVAPAQAARAEGETGGAPVAVAPVEIAPAIDRVGFTTATGPATLHVAGKTRWAGPLGAMTRLVLARDLASRLPGATVLMPGDPVPPGGVREVRVNIQDFMPGRSGRVSLEADWTIAAPDRQTILHRGRFHVALPGGGKPAAEARTMSETLGRLADAIADAL